MMSSYVAVRLAAVWGRNLKKRSSVLLIIVIIFSFSVLHKSSDLPLPTQREQGEENDGREKENPEEVEVTMEMIETMLQNLKQMISTRQTTCRRLRRLGGKVSCSCETQKCFMDGSKQVCFDDDVRPVPGDCLALSLGIGYELSFDVAITNYGCRVIAMDPTNANVTDRVHSANITDSLYKVRSIPPDHRIKKQFHAVNLGVDDHDHTMVLNITIDRVGYVSNVAPYRSYKTILEILDNPKVNILKIDIEGAEWRVLEQILWSPNGQNLLQHVQQILLEIHLDFLNGKSNMDAVIDGTEKTLNILLKLRRYGFHLAAYDANITVQNFFAFQEVEIPLYRELTLIRRLPHRTSVW